MPPPEPEDHADDRGGRRRRPVRRVRLLRARLPQPRPHDDPAPADRPAARDGAPARGLARPRGSARPVRVRRDPDLCGRRHLRARVPARDRHRHAGQDIRAQEHSQRDQRTGVAVAKRWAKVEKAARLGLRARPVSKALSGAGRAVLSDELVPAWPDEMPPPAPSTLPDYPPGRRRRGLSAGLHQPDLRAEPSRGARPGIRARGPPTLDPRRRARPLLRGPVELEGLRRGRRLDGRPHRRGGKALGR